MKLFAQLTSGLAFLIFYLYCLPMHNAYPQNNNVYISTSNGISLVNKNGIITCDGLECPQGTYKCTVEKCNTAADLNSIQTTRQCFDDNGAVLKKSDNNATNPNPGQRVSQFAEMHSSGSVFQCSNCNSTNYQQMEVKQRESATRVVKGVNKYRKRITDDIRQFEISLRKQLANIFSGSFPF